MFLWDVFYQIQTAEGGQALHFEFGKTLIAVL